MDYRSSHKPSPEPGTCTASTIQEPGRPAHSHPKAATHLSQPLTLPGGRAHSQPGASRTPITSPTQAGNDSLPAPHETPSQPRPKSSPSQHNKQAWQQRTIPACLEEATGSVHTLWNNAMHRKKQKPGSSRVPALKFFPTDQAKTEARVL